MLYATQRFFYLRHWASLWVRFILLTMWQKRWSVLRADAWSTDSACAKYQKNRIDNTEIVYGSLCDDICQMKEHFHPSFWAKIQKLFWDQSTLHPRLASMIFQPNYERGWERRLQRLRFLLLSTALKSLAHKKIWTFCFCVMKLLHASCCDDWTGMNRKLE